MGLKLKFLDLRNKSQIINSNQFSKLDPHDSSLCELVPKLSFPVNVKRRICQDSNLACRSIDIEFLYCKHSAG